MVPGQGKSGTTMIHAALKAHPEVFVPDEKEIGFFYDEKYHYGSPYYEYHYYNGYNGEKMIGDCFSANMFGEHVPERICEYLGPNTRFIFAMRQPVDRAISHYSMAVRQLREMKTFEEALKKEASRYTLHPKIRQGQSYIGRGYYATQIKQFLKYFPRKNMMFLILEEDFTESKQAETLKNMFQFLGVSPISTRRKRFLDFTQRKSFLINAAPKELGLNVSVFSDIAKYLNISVKAPTRELRERLSLLETLLKNNVDDEYAKAVFKVHYENEVRELEDIIDRDLSIWYARY